MSTFNRWLDHMQKTRRRDSRGAALVESAIVLVPLCIIIFGIIEFGFIFKDSLSISNASRAGARVGSAEPGSATFYSDIVSSVKTAGTAAGYSSGDQLMIYEVDTSTGSVNPSGVPKVGNNLVCNASTQCNLYTWGAGGWGGGGSAWPNTAQKACLGGDIQSVGVLLKVKHHSITGFFPFLNNLPLTEHTVMRLEPQQQSDGSGSC